MQLFEFTEVISKSWMSKMEITVEPAVFLTLVAQQIAKFVDMNLYLNKVCRINGTMEPDLSVPCIDEDLGVKFIASTYSITVTVVQLTNTILAFFAAIYSDLAGQKRKVLILLPIIGLLGETLSGGLQSWFWTWPVNLGLYCTTIMNALDGGYTFIHLFPLICVSDQTSNEDRLFRLYVLACVRELAMMVGRGSSGFLLRQFGFFYTYLVCFFIAIGAIICTYFLVHDVRKGKAKSPMENCSSSADSLGTSQNKDALATTFNLKKLCESYKSIFWSDKRPLRHRCTVIIMLIVGTLIYFVLKGEESVLYLYLRYRFHWDEKKFSVYSLYKIFTTLVGGMLFTIVMNKLLKVHDTILSCIACFMDTLATLGLFLAANDWQLYIIPLIDALHGVAYTVFASFISKFYLSEEFGRLKSIHMIFGLIVPFSAVLYNYIFKTFMTTMPSIMFLLSAGINVISLFGCILSYYLSHDVQ